MLRKGSPDPPLPPTQNSTPAEHRRGFQRASRRMGKNSGTAEQTEYYMVLGNLYLTSRSTDIALHNWILDFGLCLTCCYGNELSVLSEKQCIF